MMRSHNQFFIMSVLWEEKIVTQMLPRHLQADPLGGALLTQN